MMKQMKWLLLAVVTISCHILQAQNSERAQSLFDKGYDFYLEGDSEKAVDKYLDAAREEEQSRNPDFNFIGDTYLAAASIRNELYAFADAIDLTYKALAAFRTAENPEMIYEVILKLEASHSNLKLWDQPFPPATQQGARTVAMFPVDTAVMVSPDTMLVRILGGKNEGIILNDTGYVFSIYGDDPARGNKYLGLATPYTLTDNYGLCVVILNDTTDPALQVRIGDLLELPCMLPSRDKSFTFNQLAKYRIRFLDNGSVPVFNQMEMLYNGDRQLEEDILDLMVKDIHDTWEFLQEYVPDNPSWSEPLGGGKFAGISMMDALKITTRADISAFLNFVSSYPGKYMGKDWKINETYATWLINYTMLGEFDHRMFFKIMELKGEELTAFVSENAWYIQDTTFQQYNDRLNEMINRSAPDSARMLNDKLLLMSIQLGNTTNQAVSLTNEGYFKMQGEDWEGAIGDFDQAILTDPTNMNAFYFRGMCYGQIKDYYHAVKDYDVLVENMPDLASGHGNRGWYLMLDGKIFESLNACKKAYETDSATMSYVLNLGHAYLLLGDTASARKYYDKTLSLAGTEKDFLTSVKDFDIFTANRWQTGYAQQAKEYMMRRFGEDYRYYIQADSLYDVSIALKDAQKYDEAVTIMLASYEAEQKAKNPRDYYLYVEVSWIGYIYQLMGEYAKSDEYYRECLRYAHGVMDNDAYTSNVYALMADNYKAWDKKTEYYASRQKSEVYQQKSEEAGKTRRLFLIAAGDNVQQGLEYKYAEKDAMEVAEAFISNPSDYYDTVITFVLTGKCFTFQELEKAFKTAIVDSRPDDIFVFYLAGSGSSDSSRFRIELEDAESPGNTVWLDVNLIRTWISGVGARNQLLVLDAYAPGFIDEFVSGYTSSRGALSASNLNLGIIGIKGYRLEDDSLGHGKLSFFLSDIVRNGAGYLPEGDKSLTVKEVDAQLIRKNSEQEGLLSWNTFHTGNDFILVSYDSVTFADARPRVEPSRRGVGSLSMDVETAADPFAEGKNYALLFATDNYDEWGDLINPIFDATALARTLQEYYGFEVELLTDLDQVQVLTKIREYQKKQYNPNDQLFIFFAGHGSFDDISGEGYIVCSDSRKVDEIMASYISFSYLRENVNNIRHCNHVLLTLDVCFGGTFDKRVASSGRGPNDYSQITRDELIARTRQYKSRLFITSGSKEYVSDGDPGKHSPFASRILEVLRSQGTVNGYVTFNQMVQSVERLQTTPRYGDFGDNEPGSEFIFSAKSSPAQQAFKSASQDRKFSGK